MRSKNLLFFCLFFTTSLMAQTLSHQVVTGSSDFDNALGIYKTGDGGYVVGGNSNGGISKNKTSPNYGRSDYWLVKYDSVGHKLWDKSYGGSYDEYFSNMIVAKDGGFLLIGSSISGATGVKSDSNRGNFDYWIVKTDSAGNKQWDKTFGGNSDDEGLAVTQTLDGGYILGGYSNSNISGEKSQDSKGYADFWIIKINATGALQWSKTIGGDNDDIVYQIKQSADSSYLLGGYSNSNISGNKTGACRGTNQNTDIWLVKINAAGSVLWDKTIGGDESEYMHSFDTTRDGGYILGAYSASDISYDKTVPNRGVGTSIISYDYWVIKLSRTGAIQWQSAAGGDDADHLYYIKQTQDGGYIAAGETFSSLSGDKTEAQRGYGDAWIVKFSNSGAIEWDKSLGGSQSDFAGFHSVIELGNDRYVLGMTSASGVSGDKTIPSRGIEDIWLGFLQYSPSPLLSGGAQDKSAVPAVKAISPASMQVTPNPVKDVMHIQANGKLSLLSLSGKVLLTQTVNGKADFNVSNLPGGMYILRNETTGAIKKVMITK